MTQRTPFGGKESFTSPSSAFPTTLSIMARPKPEALGRAHRRATLLFPSELQLCGVAELPMDAHAAAAARERAIFLRVRGKLVQREAEILHGLRLQHHVLTVDDDLSAHAVRSMHAQLLLDQGPQRGAVPIIGDEQILRAADGDQPRAEAIEKVVDGLGARGGLPGDGLNNGKLILRAVGELAQQQTELVLSFLPLGDLDGDGRGADRIAFAVAERLHQQIVGAPPPEQLEIAFDRLRLSGFHCTAASPP